VQAVDLQLELLDSLPKGGGDIRISKMTLDVTHTVRKPSKNSAGGTNSHISTSRPLSSSFPRPAYYHALGGPLTPYTSREGE
jgi:hypothetical protein